MKTSPRPYNGPVEPEVEDGDWEEMREPSPEDEAPEEQYDMEAHNEEEVFDPMAVAEYRSLNANLTGNAKKLADWARQYHADSAGEAPLTEYRILAGELDKLVGKNNHNLLLGVLLCRETHSDNRPGEKFVRFLLAFLRERVPQLDAMGKSVKGADGKVVHVANSYYRKDFTDAVVETWAQIQSQQPEGKAPTDLSQDIPF